MKPVLLIIFAASLVGLLFVFAHHYTHLANDPQLVKHPAGDMLAVNFAHADHMEQNCVTCHHNFVDDTGTGMCFDCHKTQPEVAPLIEQQFHDLCRDCHIENQLDGHDHGPTRQCIDCHVTDNRP